MIYQKKTYFECVIPERNKRAFYELIGGQDLFGYVLIRRWGRIGTKGQPVMRQRFSCESEMLQEFHRVQKRRLKREYASVPEKESCGEIALKNSRRLKFSASVPGRECRTFDIT